MQISYGNELNFVAALECCWPNLDLWLIVQRGVLKFIVFEQSVENRIN